MAHLVLCIGASNHPDGRVIRDAIGDTLARLLCDNKAPSGTRVRWARERPSRGKAKRDVELPLWHPAEAVNDTAIRTACQRFFAAPLKMRSKVPDDDTCPLCLQLTAGSMSRGSVPAPA